MSDDTLERFMKKNPPPHLFKWHPIHQTFRRKLPRCFGQALKLGCIKHCRYWSDCMEKASKTTEEKKSGGETG